MNASMHQLWPLLFIQSSASNHVYPSGPKIDVRAEHAAGLCDVRRIMRRTMRSFSSLTRHFEQPPRLHVRVVIAQIAGDAWNFDLSMVAPVRSSTPWRLSAPTCTLAAQRTATKLGLIAPSLSWSTAPPPAQTAAVARIPAQPTPPALQRPRRVDRGPGVQTSKEPTTRSVPVAIRPGARSVCCAGQVVARTPPPVDPRRGAGLNELRIRTEARVAHGVLPRPVATGVRLVVAAFGRHVRAEFGASLDYAGEWTVAGDPRVRHPGRVAARVSFCRDLVVRSVDLHLCAGLDGGIILMKNIDRTAKPWMVHLHVSPGVTWWFRPRVGLFAGFSAGPALARPNFYLGPGPEELAESRHPMPREFVEAAVGLEIRLPGTDGQPSNLAAAVTPGERSDRRGGRHP